jgi:hypothetical protein
MAHITTHRFAQDETEDTARSNCRADTELAWRSTSDGASLTLWDAILRHRGETDQSTRDFRKLPAQDQEAVLEFLRSL